MRFIPHWIRPHCHLLSNDPKVNGYVINLLVNSELESELEFWICFGKYRSNFCIVPDFSHTVKLANSPSDIALPE